MQLPLFIKQLNWVEFLPVDESKTQYSNHNQWKFKLNMHKASTDMDGKIRNRKRSFYLVFGTASQL